MLCVLEAQGKGEQVKYSVDYCKDCRRQTVWRVGTAIDNTYWPANAARGVTISKTGPPVVLKVAKCQACGRSRTIPSEK